MTNRFESRLDRLEKYAPHVANSHGESPLPKLQAFVLDNGGRLDGESWLAATARLLDMTQGELTDYLKARTEGVKQ